MAGEIAIRGPQVMAGYWQRPDETAKVMTRDGFFRTGDIGMVDERGYFRIVDRKKDMILVSGFNVYPNEIEDLISTLPGVLECAAFGVPDAKAGEAVKLVVVKKDPALSEADIRNFCEANLTGYKRPQDASSSATSCRRARSARSCAASCAKPRPEPDMRPRSRGSAGEGRRLQRDRLKPADERVASGQCAKRERMQARRGQRSRGPPAPSGTLRAMSVRLYVDAALQRDAELDLPAAAARHVQVRGCSPPTGCGCSTARAANGRPRCCTWAAARCACASMTFDPVERELGLRVTVALGMPANERMDLLVEKATELGVAADPAAAVRALGAAPGR